MTMEDLGGSPDYVSNHEQANRDYYNEVSASAQTSTTSPFNGTSGMGVRDASPPPDYLYNRSGSGRCRSWRSWLLRHRPRRARNAVPMLLYEYMDGVVHTLCLSASLSKWWRR